MFGRKKNVNSSSSAKNCEAAKETSSAKSSAKSTSSKSKCSCGKKTSSSKACK